MGTEPAHSMGTEPAYSTSERTSQGSTIPIKKTGPAHSMGTEPAHSMGTEPAHDNRQLNIKIAERINDKYHKYLIPFLIKDNLFIMPGGFDYNKFESIFQLDLNKKKNIIRKLINDLKILFNNGYYYTDLKPANIILIATKLEKDKYNITPYLGDIGSISMNNVNNDNRIRSLKYCTNQDSSLIPTNKEGIIINTIINNIYELLGIKINVSEKEKSDFNTFCDTIIRKIDALNFDIS